ncbi:hypothetical protein APHAL10511_001581 [Amanita phalloides]|nr:hypothetical protein APHAL10511_001581 [Amanita phalloides]
MEGNPLMNAVKRTKKDAKSASYKSKLQPNAEPMPNGLVIVRGSPYLQPDPSTCETSTSLQPSPTLPLKRNASSDLRPPPPKKARAESQPPIPSESSHLSATSQPSPAEQPQSKFTPITEEAVEEQIEDDVRAMDAEADHLRRSSRIYVPPFSSTSTSLTFSSENGKPRARSRSRGNVMVTDTIQAIAFDNESLQIERNKRLRESAMNAIAATNGGVTHAETSRRGRERERDSNMVNGHRQRRSSVSGRGKRISTSFEVAGVIAQPHNSVSDTSFYKHIDADLPHAERLRTLLIWCASRAAGKSSSLKPNSTKDNNPDPPPDHDLPPLSERAQQTLKELQDDVIRMLAEKRIDLSLYGSIPAQSGEGLKPNEQNVTNRMLELRYTEQIKRAQEEEEAWKRVSYHYDAYIKRQKEDLAKRKARMSIKVPPSTNHSHSGGDVLADEAQPPTPSAKAKGKQRDMGTDDSWKAINEHDLPEDMQRGIRLARALVATTQPKPPSVQPTTSPSQKRQRRGSDTYLPTSTLPDGDPDLIGQALDEEVERRLLDMEFKLDYVLASAHVAWAMVSVAEELLNRWFALLNHNLASRVNIQLGVPSASPSSSSAGLANATSTPPTSASYSSNLGGFLNKYVPRQLPPGGFVITGHEDWDSSSPSSSVGSLARIPPSSGVDPRDVFRALSRVDQTRPPAMVGDAARRAAREVQRVGESGVQVVGERRLTGVGAGAGGSSSSAGGTGGMLHTPRKAPTTPRRGGDRTPRRDRSLARERDR